MKKIIITLMLIAGGYTIAAAQTAKMNPDTSITYLTNTFKKGQQVQLFYGSGANKEFEFVNLKDTKTYQNETASSDYSKRILKISQVYFVGSKAFIRGRNDDDTDIVIDVEGAIDNKEIVAPNNVAATAPVPVKKVVKKKELTMFDRARYYSLTEIQKKFKISRTKLGKLLDEYKPPVIENKITYGTWYSVTAKYYLIEDIENIIKIESPK